MSFLQMVMVGTIGDLGRADYIFRGILNEHKKQVFLLYFFIESYLLGMIFLIRTAAARYKWSLS